MEFKNIYIDEAITDEVTKDTILLSNICEAARIIYKRMLNVELLYIADNYEEFCSMSKARVTKEEYNLLNSVKIEFYRVR